MILGGGRTKFLPKTETDAEGFMGEREDGHNLIEEWLNNRQKAEFIHDKNGLKNLNLAETEYVLGLFAAGHMNFHLDADEKKEPTLMEMTETAIKLLQKEKHGYFLFVEGGRIDHGHHYAQGVVEKDKKY